MLDVFRGLKSLVKVTNLNIDSPVFRLHYSITVMMLIAFSLIVTTRQYVGNPIDCIHTKDIPEDVLNTYCWIHSTYTIKSAFKKKVGEAIAYPGVDNSRDRNAEDRKTYKYYQWVCFCLFFQAVRIFLRYDRPWIIGYIMWLHCKLTSALLTAFCLILAARQFVGNPIECDHGPAVSSTVLDSWCWIHSTYSVKESFTRLVGEEIPYPGLSNSKRTREPRKLHSYYQWVAFCLFFQALLFYTPRWLWKNWEGGKIHSLMMDLDLGICSDIEKRQKKKLLLDYLWENLRYHNCWCYRYYFCELLSLLNVIGQMFLMDRFFDGAFLTFGLEVLWWLDSDQEDRVDPMIFIFPRMTKCTFYKYGVSGDVERHDAVCILPLNVVNEKIYIFLWFWFLLLGALTVCVLFYRIIIILSPRIRIYLLRMRFRLVKSEAIELFVRRGKIGDWFLLYMLGENIDMLIFRDVMHELAGKLGKPIESDA